MTQMNWTGNIWGRPSGWPLPRGERGGERVKGRVAGEASLDARQGATPPNLSEHGMSDELWIVRVVANGVVVESEPLPRKAAIVLYQRQCRRERALSGRDFGVSLVRAEGPR